MGRFLEESVLVRRTAHLRFLVLAHACVWATVAFCLVPAARAQLLADGIAAVVNDKVITYVQINQQVAYQERILRESLQGEQLFERLKEAKLSVLKSLIEQQLIIQDFKTQGGFIPETFTDERINDEIRTEYGGDRVAYIRTLYERGVTIAQRREEIENNAIVGYMRNKNVVQTVLVSPYQIEQYYQQNLRLFQQEEQIRVATIVLRKSLFPSQKTDKDGKQITYDPQEEVAKEILYKLDTGADFAEMAKTYSEAGNKDDGGELGWITQNGKTAIRSDLWPPISKLEPGQHTDVIPTSDGFFYIVEVEDRKNSAMTPLEDVRSQIEQTVINEQTQVRQQAWLDSLRAKAFIKMFL
jgi:peptidyl-prolyl cis-trans isomerase SurA